jgi:sugar/nucleoside kinase (ribokinase family)
LWLEDGELRQFPAFRVDVVDTLGAGDTFHGAFALMLAEGVDIRMAVRFSAAAAAIKCANRERAGILGAPSRAEVDAFLTRN